MQIIPALDLLGDEAVRLEQGDFHRVLFRQPLEEFMGRLVATGPPMIHVVDLQGARDGALRPVVIERCRRAAQGTPLQVSGGIRSIETAQEVLAAGAARVIVGTALWSDDDAITDFVEALGDRLVAAIDVKDGRLASRGWVTRLHVTAIERDGTMRGPDLALYERICAGGIPVVAAGGIRNDADVAALADVGCEAAVMGVGYLTRLGLSLEG
jgi:phosphoribosylformimino-5-aminoimidazole carboxamide ribotide isomerase